MPKNNIVNEIERVLNSLRIQKIGKGDVIPGIRVEGTYSKNDVIDYSPEKAKEIISEIRDTQGVSSLHVLSKDGVSMEVYPYGKNVVILSEENNKRLSEIKNNLDKFDYSIIFPNDKGDNL